MSMNCNQLELWQTPTQISYMCTKGKGELKGIEAKEALEIYKQYVKYSSNGVWQDLKEHQAWIEKHIKEIDKILNENKFGLKVWVA